MFLSEPAPTGYDLNFSIFGFDVRVHPVFFVMPILFGRGFIGPDINTGVGWLILIGIFFVSILVHELGHAFAFRHFGSPCHIVLYWMGGLAIPSSGRGVWSSPSRRSLTPNQQIVVSLTGPIFGFLLAGVLCLLVMACGGNVGIGFLGPIPIPYCSFAGSVFADNAAIQLVFHVGIIFNVFINLFNLVPVFPLDGGQATRQVMLQLDSFNGLKNSIILSIATCAILVLYGLSAQSMFIAFFFGFMGWSNYQTLQQYGGRRW